MAAKENAVEVVETEEVQNVSAIFPLSRIWEKVDDLYQIEGFDLEKNKMELVGVPFIITGVTYREGKFKRGNEVMEDDYVSVECVTAPPEIYERMTPKNRKKYADDGIPTVSEIGPNEFVVFNDSSTGIKRQITSYLHMMKLIQIDEILAPFGSVQHNMTGSYGENLLDYSRAQWVSGAKQATDGFSLGEQSLACKRGLRPSKYENEWTPEGITYYLA